MASGTDDFRIEVPDAVLSDLRDRLRRTKRARTIGTDWSAGTDGGWLADFTSYWADEFDWRRTERRLARLPQRIVRVAGVPLHVVHVRADPGRANPMPIVLTHGWPSSFLEFLPLLERLTAPARFGADPADAFDVVVPSLPGFGFSGLPADGPVEPAGIARLWVGLMGELGYERFGAYGGDIGSHVTNFLGAAHPEQLVGVYTHHPNLRPDIRADEPLSAAERAYLTARESSPNAHDFSYSAVQAARPDSLSPALSDSPAGLAAWILEKYREWSDNDGTLESAFDRRSLAEIVTLYWVTDSIGSSFRPYADDTATPPLPPVLVPAGVTLTPEDAGYPKEWAARTYRDIRQWRGPTRGGHFLALEQPELLAEDLRDFFRPLRGSLTAPD